MPQYEVGHLDRVGRIEAGAGQHRGLALAGNYFRGPGIPDCIDRAEQAASSLYRDLFSGAY
jgi:oxygen-dependent protoporphyrinogen oxidase